MKHNLKITAILLTMFIVTQLIGIYVVSYYSHKDVVLPFGLNPPQPQQASDYPPLLGGIIFAFVIAVLLLFLFTKFKLKFVLKAWFFVVIVIALSISFIAILPVKLTIVALILAIPFTIIKISGKNLLVHNFTELLIYPGIASVFVPVLNVWTIVILLILISIYDMWAVWHSGIMQKMAKYQINTLKVFSGFFVPYASKKVRQQISKWKQSLTKKQLDKKKIKVNVAILGGGDIVFPIITAGVVLTTISLNLPFGLKPFIGGFWPAIFVILGATLGLSYLFFAAEKKKFYPAMPFISAGIFLGILVSYLIL